ncbi:riboflavin synthase subunit alpha [Gammaproteobacteria bacterium 45_16_T64]|nr:riboflavin synthase subunit alpha [Gammaproteobacteria bacterium 45_16_T64]
MFTGIIEAVGHVAQIDHRGGDVRLRVLSGALDLADVKLGDSIATNGVCLTVVELLGDGFWADVSLETLKRTSFKQLSVGTKVNLEKALTPTTRLGGHIVSGHVDGLGEILSRKDDARSIHLQVKAPNELARYLSEKGSICVDGVSLTINALDGAVFSLNIVPHTSGETTVDLWRTGVEVNLEVDIIARYLERLLLGDKAAEPVAGKQQGVTLAHLAEHGFLNR